MQAGPRAARPARHLSAAARAKETAAPNPPGQLRRSHHGETRGTGGELRAKDRVGGRARFRDLFVPVPSRTCAELSFLIRYLQVPATVVALRAAPARRAWGRSHPCAARSRDPGPDAPLP